MTSVTFRVLQGADRGRVYADLRPPLTIGREEGNTIQLNDERVSRFHVKIQEDNNRLILTDLESTNGTKVNGQDCQIRLLRYGDIVSIGRSILLFGSRDEILNRLREQSSEERSSATAAVASGKGGSNIEDSSLDFEYGSQFNISLQQLASLSSVPAIPDHLSPSQAAQLAELLEHFHAAIRKAIESSQLDEKKQQVSLNQSTWQLILEIQTRISEFIRKIADP